MTYIGLVIATIALLTAVAAVAPYQQVGPEWLGPMEASTETVTTAEDAAGGVSLRQSYESARTLTLWWITQLAEIGAALLAVGYLIHRIQRWRWSSYTPALRVSEFQAKGNAANISMSFASALVAEYQRLTKADGAGSNRLAVESQIVAPVKAVSVEDVISNVTSWPTALVGALSLFPRRGFSVEGVLHEPGSLGGGITVRISLSGDVVAALTLWQADVDCGWNPADEGQAEFRKVDSHAYYSLAQYAAIWIWFETTRRIPLFQRPAQAGPSLLGTRSVSAYIEFQAGVNAEKARLGDWRETARKHYVKALRYDASPTFHAARYNLANLVRPEHYDLTIRTLRDVFQNGEAKDATRYYAGYRLAVRLHVLEQRGDLRHGSAIAAFEVLKRDVNGQIAALRTKPERWTTASDRELLRFLAGFLKPLIVVGYLGLRLQSVWSSRRYMLLTRYERKASVPRHYYNLACAYSLAADSVGVNQPLSRQLCLKSAEMLRAALMLDPDFRANAEVDEDLRNLRNFVASFDWLVDGTYLKYKVQNVEEQADE